MFNDIRVKHFEQGSMKRLRLILSLDRVMIERYFQCFECWTF